MLVTTSEGFKAEVIEQGAQSVQSICDKLNQTHFEGRLPGITALAVSRFEHPHSERLNAITFKAEELPKDAAFGNPWVIFIHERYCGLPEQMTHILMPDESPYHSAKFWTTLKEKWLLDFDLVLGVGLNGDEKPTGLVQELLATTNLLRMLGL